MPSEMTFLKLMFENAPIIGVIVTAVILLLVAIARAFGLATIVGDRTKLVDDSKIAAVNTGIADIKSKLDGMETRMSVVEHDLTTRATKEEVHRLEIAVTKMEVRFESLASNVQSIGNGVHRIEEFMYDAALRSKQA